MWINIQPKQAVSLKSIIGCHFTEKKIVIQPTFFKKCFKNERFASDNYLFEN